MERKFIPLSVPNFKGNEKKYVTEAVVSEWVSTGGSKIIDFEKNIAKYLNSSYAVACQNGTAAIHISLIEAGIHSDDEILVPTLTFIAPINAIRYIGAYPVFFDCDDNLNINADGIMNFIHTNCIFNNNILINKKTNRKITAILPVHVFGHPADMYSIMNIAQQYNLKVIEDATESLGSYYTEGNLKDKYCGNIGDFGCLSFNGNKIITTGGGGMVLTKNEDHYLHIKYLTTQAKNDEIFYIHDEIGYNYRMTNIQAALGLGQLEQLNEFIAIKRKNFHYYKENLKHMEGLSFIEEPGYSESNYWFYSLKIDPNIYNYSHKNFVKYCSDNSFQVRPIWYLNHLQKPFKEFESFDIKNALELYPSVINIPCSTNISGNDMDYICDQISHFFKGIKK